MTYWPQAKTKTEMLEQLGFMPAKSRFPQKNTLDYTDNEGVRRIRLHNTDVVTLFPNGAFELNSGGWNTPTTRNRMSGYMPQGWYVCTQKGQMFLGHYDAKTRNRQEWPFLRRISVGPRGGVKSDQTPNQLEALRRKLNSFMRVVKSKGLPPVAESGGDPWVFGSVDRETVLDWIETKYWTRRLFSLALEARFQSASVEWTLYDVDRKGGDLTGYHAGLVRRYLKRHLGLA